MDRHWNQTNDAGSCLIHGVASVTPYANEYLRLGPSLVNAEENFDRALRRCGGWV